MPHRRVPRHPSLVGRFGTALAIVGVLALTSVVASAAHAQDGPGMGMPGAPGMAGPGGPRGFGRGYGGGDSGIVLGQTQFCRDYPGAVADFDYFAGPYPTTAWAVPWGFPVYANFNVPPYGGYWGYYSGSGPICAWQPH